MINKNIGVCYRTEKNGPLIMYKACASEEEAIGVIINNKEFKAIEKTEVFLAVVVEDGEESAIIVEDNK